jgi:hypothetical protein
MGGVEQRPDQVRPQFLRAPTRPTVRVAGLAIPLEFRDRGKAMVAMREIEEADKAVQKALARFGFAAGGTLVSPCTPIVGANRVQATTLEAVLYLLDDTDCRSAERPCARRGEITERRYGNRITTPGLSGDARLFVVEIFGERNFGLAIGVGRNGKAETFSDACCSAAGDEGARGVPVAITFLKLDRARPPPGWLSRSMAWRRF